MEKAVHLSTKAGPEVPGEPTKMGTSMVDSAAAAVQSFTPINQIHQHLCAFHFYAYDMTRQVEAHHFCGHINEDMRQCLIYDGPDANARLIGLEYIVSEKLFMTLPDDEKKLWHTHEWEVKGGFLFMPGVPEPIQRQDLEIVAKTYGKVYHFWQVDLGHELPIGLPNIMMAVTRDGQLYPEMVKETEKKFGISIDKERESRAYMTGPDHGIHPLANGGGKGLKLEMREVDIKPVESVPRVFV
ncbi:unnamed protein product [Brassica rapa subsp. trilocularis]